MTRQIGRPVTRNEDPRLLAGRALFVDDVAMPGMLHAAFLRSPHAHAGILSVDTSRAKARPGVVAVVTAEDLGDDWKPGPLLVPPPPIPGRALRLRMRFWNSPRCCCRTAADTSATCSPSRSPLVTSATS